MAITVTKQELENLARINCTKLEICAYFGCAENTLLNRVREFYDLTVGEFLEQYSGQGKVSLRRQGWRQALSGKNWPATKFMMENELGMGDNVRNRLEGFDGGPVKLENAVTFEPGEASRLYLEKIKNGK